MRDLCGIFGSEAGGVGFGVEDGALGILPAMLWFRFKNIKINRFC